MIRLFTFFHGMVKKSRAFRFPRVPNDLIPIPNDIIDEDEIAVFRSGWRACERGAQRSSPHAYERFNFLWLSGFDERLNYDENMNNTLIDTND
jgi:hypothetical protein